ncbi:uridine kinase [Marisediminicola sp. UYEF4]|uniref:ATP-binding protein n=1 Tax=Marisediminicola sp. UYEF4 TaxID=1756384 RepID=UPI00339770CE
MTAEPIAAVFSALAAAATPGRRPVVLVDGGSGSGKSTLARLLVAQWAANRPGEKVSLVRLDDFYPGWDGLEVAARQVTDDLLAPLAAGQPGRWRRWDWTNGAHAEWHSVDPASALVVEGSGALGRASRALATLGVWVELDADERRRRAIARDGEAYEPHWDRWAAQEARFAAREHPDRLADVVIDGRSIAP